MPTVNGSGVQLYYEEAGKGDTLVLVHGSWLDHFDWRLVVPTLARIFRVITYDRRGHGRSEAGPAEGSFGEDAEDLARLIEELGEPPTHLLGHSSGAIIALLLAADRPELVRTMNLHEPPLFELAAGDPRAQPLLASVGAALGSVRKKLEQGDYENAARQFSDEVAFGPGIWEDGLTPEDRGMMVKNAPTFLDELRQPSRLRVDVARLGRLDRPVLLTQGALSSPLRGLSLDALAPALPRVERRVLPNAAHLPHHTTTDSYAQVVVDFARGQSPGRE